MIKRKPSIVINHEQMANRLIAYAKQREEHLSKRKEKMSESCMNAQSKTLLNQDILIDQIKGNTDRCAGVMKKLQAKLVNDPSLTRDQKVFVKSYIQRLQGVFGALKKYGYMLIRFENPAAQTTKVLDE